MKELCRIFGILILVFGVFGSIAWGWENGSFICLLAGIFLTVMLSLMLLAFAEILENQEYLISASAELLRRIEGEESVPENGWKCTGCGRINPDYTGTCACGKTKQEN